MFLLGGSMVPSASALSLFNGSGGFVLLGYGDIIQIRFPDVLMEYYLRRRQSLLLLQY